jgi:hypothetical protein
LTTPANGTDPKRNVLSTSASYVTGSHSFKSGIQWGFGDYVIDRTMNGDLAQRYRNGRPDSVRVYNTPVRSNEYLNADLGIYAQDSWTIRRLTLNAGIRFEYFNGKISEQDVAAGRFVPARHFDEVSNMPNWFDTTPRFGIAYDLFGNAKTALKATVNKYMAGQTLGFAQRYNPLQQQTDDRTWDDRNGDDVAQDNEIGPSNNLAFGLPVLAQRPDPNLQREFDMEYSLGIQHELIRGLSVTGAWYRRDRYNQRRTDSVLVSLADYTRVDVVSPLDGSVIPAYNLNASKRGQLQLQQIDVNSTDTDLRHRTYNGFELGFNARIGRLSGFGGWGVDRIVSVECDSRSDPNTFRFCDQSELGLPWLDGFKASGSYLLPWWGIQTSVAYQGYPGPVLPTRWSISRTTRYAANCSGPCTPGALVIPGLTPTSLVLELTPPGSDYYKRMNQLDFSARKIFRFGRYQYSGQVDLFNLTNSSYVKSQNVTWGPSLGQPTAILQPLTLRLALQMRF